MRGSWEHGVYSVGSMECIQLALLLDWLVSTLEGGIAEFLQFSRTQNYVTLMQETIDQGGMQSLLAPMRIVSRESSGSEALHCALGRTASRATFWLSCSY